MNRVYLINFSDQFTLSFSVSETGKDSELITWLPKQAGFECTIRLKGNHFTLQRVISSFVLTFGFDFRKSSVSERGY